LGGLGKLQSPFPVRLPCPKAFFSGKQGLVFVKLVLYQPREAQR